LRVALIGLAAAALVFLLVFGFLYFKYRRVVDDRLQQPLFASTARIYAAPREVRPGQKFTIGLIANELREAGYSPDGAGQTSPLGSFSEGALTITVRPGPQSYHSEDSATIRVTGGVVQSIADDRGQPLSSYELEPLLITGLSDDARRSKRRLLTYGEIPPNLVQAVLGIEDRRFFEHNGVNFWRLGAAAAQDIFTGHKEQGGSTLTMQLARGFFLSPEKTWKRKLIEIIITFQLEHRFSKQQIFEMYSNQINLGQRGSFSIDGFGEAAQAYFGKDVSQLNLAECATLAGMIQRPNYFNPYRHPDRTVERRNLVLDSMVETGAITKNEAERAKQEQLHLSAASVDASDAPYFVDLVHEQLLQRLGDRDFNREGLRIYTSLDPDLQRAAAAAVASTIPAGGAGGAESAHRPGAGLGRRPQLRRFAVEPRGGQAAHRLHLQAVRLRSGLCDGRRGCRPAGAKQPLFAPDHAERRAEHLRRGRPGVHAAQLRGRVPRPGDGPLCLDALAEQRHHRPGRHGGLRPRGLAGPRRRHQERARHAGRGHRRL
jgi:penicillin-binding protein 1B